MLLLIGPRRNKHESHIGGSEVLFENWIEFCENKKIKMKILDTNKFNYSNKIFAIVLIVLNILRYAPKASRIFLHGSKNDYLVLAPFAVLSGKILGKPVFLRKFAGNFNSAYKNARWWKKSLYNYSLKQADILFWETKYLVDFGRQFNSNSYWFPNTRNRPDFLNEEYLYRKKFVFISQVRKEKGIDILLEAFRLLGSDYKIDMYGTLMGYDEDQLDGCYKGTLEPSEVYKTLVKYDFLILPSLWKGEGYPGIIAEAFAVGCPTIASKVGGIPEMIIDKENGFLIESNEPKSLVAVIRSIDNYNYNKLSANALKSFNSFDAKIVNKQIYQIISHRLNF